MAKARSPKSFDGPPDLGVLSSVGATLRSSSGSDGFQLEKDRDGRLLLVLLDIGAEASQEDALAGIATIRPALLGGQPLHDVVRILRAWALPPNPRVVGALVVRFDVMLSRAEILNAGMPPLICVLPGGHPVLHPALSLKIGERPNQSHPYELTPLSRGSTWLAMSDGVSGSSDPAETETALARLGLIREAPELARGDARSLLARLEDRVPTDAMLAAGDATLVLVDWQPGPRLESGIVP